MHVFMAKPSSGLFGYIEKLHGSRPWGCFLDAGTGRHSLKWLLTLDTEEWTAITASKRMASQVRETVGSAMRDRDRILVGNWINDSLLFGETFDTVLMDYLVGAIEGFAPYWQGRVFERIRPVVTGRLYIVGVEPYVPFPANDEAGHAIRQIGCLRDACLLLAGERPYREFPMDWVIRQLGLAGFRTLDAQHFPITYRARFINGQLDMCVDRIQRFASPELGSAMTDHVEQVRKQALALAESRDGLRHGADYVIAAEPMA